MNGPGAPTPPIARRRGAGEAPPAPHLFEVFDCAAPLRPPARHSLANVDEVILVRGEVRGALRVGRTLRLSIPDRFMSGVHARLRREGNRFRVEDAGSTNGTLVNGAPAEGAFLGDRDDLELGRTLLLFRQAVSPGNGPADFDAEGAVPPAPGLGTLVLPFETELARLPAIARSSVAVVIGGETGTGKELVARALHQLSGRKGSFVPINCGAIAENLLESLLFGHRKGAFSGATETRPGLVRAAEGGTLFLDEVGDLPAASQAALLRVIQEGEVLAVGETQPVKVDVRMVAATHVDLEAAVAGHRFRADLFARISGFTVRLPPLRWRREDLGLLVAAVLRRLLPERAPRVTFTCEAARALLRYRWPHNIRELEKCLQAALVLAGDEPIDVSHLPEAVQRARETRDTDASPTLLELAPARPAERPLALSAEDTRRRDELSSLLREHRGNVAAVARVLGKGRMQIHRWLKRYQLHLEDFR